MTLYLTDTDGTRVSDGAGTVAESRLFTGATTGTLPFIAVDIAIQANGFLLADTLFASDIGYRAESPTVVSYPPVIDQAFQLDGRLPVGPGQTGITWSWGTLAVINADGAYDAIMPLYNFDGRSVSIRYGEKRWDDIRGIWVDPVDASLVTLFDGIAKTPTLDEYRLSIPLRDASYWLERKLQRNTYGGTGGADGVAALKGIGKPKLRGVGYNITLTLIDETNNTYAVSDGPATFEAVYEAGGETITFQADTGDLWTGTTSAGQYRTDVSRGFIQFGTTPTSTPTVDATGYFPTAGLVTNVAQIARYLLAEDTAMPSGYIDTASFAAADALYPYEAGFYWAPGDETTGVDAVGQVLASFGAGLAPATDGSLGIVALRAPPVSPTISGTYGTDTIISCEVRALPDAVAPPCWRIRVGYARNHTIQNDQFSGSITETHQLFVGTELRLATAEDTDVSTYWRNANDHPTIGGGLTTEADAQEVADDLLALWGVPRWQFDVVVPLATGLNDGIEIGDYVDITYPNHALSAGATCLVTGRSIDIEALTMTLTVLV